MCGRYVQRTPLQNVMELFTAVPTCDGTQWVPRFNIAPTQEIPVVRNNPQSKRTLDMLRWGLIPFWAKDPAVGNRLINARAETAAQKPAFRQAFQHRRCLIPADGFYEWKKTGKQKQPYYFHRKDHAPFAFAGLWDRWEKDGIVIESCTILTTTANTVVKPIHDRMPLILDPSEYKPWLDMQTPLPHPPQPMLHPGPFKPKMNIAEQNLIATPVSQLVSNVQNQGPCLIEEIHIPEFQSLFPEEA